MDKWVRDHQQALAASGGAVVFVLGLYLVLIPAGLLPAGLILVLIGAVFIALGLFGERDAEVGGGPFRVKISGPVAERVKQVVGTGQVRVLAPKVEGRGEVSATQPVAKDAGDEGAAKDRVAQPTVVTPEPLGVELKTVAPEVIVQAASAMAEAATPEQLAERVVEFVRVAGRPDRAAVVDFLAWLPPDERDQLVSEAEQLAGRLGEQENP